MAEILRTRCCIVGGGPAGMMLGLLLARAGIDVVVLEKHSDFLRDFRGDTVHPSTLEVVHELGLLDGLLARPHQEVRSLAGHVEGERVPLAEFGDLPVHSPFIVLMPQWDFLDYLAGAATRFPAFHLRMETECTDVLIENERVVGVRARSPVGRVEVRSDLVVAADGRHSVVRARAALPIQDVGSAVDVLWLRLSRRPHDPLETLGYLGRRHVMVLLNRGDYWQCGFVIAKGGWDDIRRRGLSEFRQDIVALVPFLGDRVGEIASWDDVRLLTVRIDRLIRWYRPGLLCIGDAAHAMSPVGGVGINLAIQDAVAAANLLVGPLRRGPPSVKELAAVQRRRDLPTRFTQRLQAVVQDRILGRRVRGESGRGLPPLARLLRDHPSLRRIPGRLVGMGFRPEHVRTPEDGG